MLSPWIITPLLILSLHTQLLAGTIYVNQAATGANNGASWTNAYTDLQNALSSAVAGDEIWVAQGSYKPTSGTSRFISFELKKGIALYGGFSGNESLLSERNDNPLTNGTILTGDLNGDDAPNFVNRNDNTSSVVKTSPLSDATTILDGFTITAGRAIYGGGLNCTVNTSPTIRNCLFTDNTASEGGAASFEYTDSPSFTNCTFSNNQAASGGGALYSYSSEPTFSHCSFSSNSATNGNGGAIHSDSSELTVSHCIFSHNSADDNGGAINNLSSKITLTNCTFSENTAGGYGGAIHESNLSKQTSITNCSFTKNSTVFDGGALYYTSFSKPTVMQCSFQENTAEHDGGAIALKANCNINITNSSFTKNSAEHEGGAISTLTDTVKLSLSGCDFHGNSAPWGGAIYDTNVRFLEPFNNCSFTSNSASNNGGAIVYTAWWTSDGRPLNNCRFHNNTARLNGGAIFNTGSPILTNCIFSGNSCLINDGGAIHTSNSPRFTNCIFSGNASIFGNGGALASSGSESLINCSLSGNSCRSLGGAFFKSSGTSTLYNCIIWNNQAMGLTTSPRASIFPLNINSYHCLIQNYSSTTLNGMGFNNSDGTIPSNNPLFLNPVNPTISPTTSGDLRLRNGSPAFDLGNNTANTTSLDLAGNTRIQNTTIDLGAYEGGYQTTFSTLFPTLDPAEDENGNGLSNFADYSLGVDPTVPHNPNTALLINGTQITLKYRVHADDVTPSLFKSTNLTQWFEMIEGTDYSLHSESDDGYQKTKVINLLITPGSSVPTIYFRQKFESGP